VISVESLSKVYRLGQIGGRTLTEDVNRWWARVHGRPDPSLKIGQEDRHTRDGERIWALREVTCAVRQGDILGIVGRNGAGKSTLLKVISRITAPSSGEVRIKGRVASLLEVGTGFHPELTGRENVYLNGAILGMTRDEVTRKLDAIVGFAEVERFLDTPVKRYSSGMYVRLAFAVAAHLDPEILVVDEVLAVGDAAFQRKCLGRMGEVAGEGRTVLFVSHNLLALRSLCPRAIWLEAGRIAADGPSEEVVARYLSLQDSDVRERVWPDPSAAPGNDKVRVRRVWLEPATPREGAVVDRETALEVGVEYWHLAGESDLHVTLHVLVEGQVIAFSSASFHDPSWQEVSRAPGLVRSSCEIPARLLNAGHHRVNVLVVEDRSRVVFTLPDALSFDVADTEPRAGGWYGRQPGAVRPHLPWRSRRLAPLPGAVRSHA